MLYLGEYSQPGTFDSSLTLFYGREGDIRREARVFANAIKVEGSVIDYSRECLCELGWEHSSEKQKRRQETGFYSLKYIRQSARSLQLTQDLTANVFALEGV